VATAIAGGLAAAAYFDARFLIRHDLRVGSVARNTRKAAEFVAEEFPKTKVSSMTSSKSTPWGRMLMTSSLYLKIDPGPTNNSTTI
jgi:hypothetical protein